jgi:hypothetical protein
LLKNILKKTVINYNVCHGSQIVYKSIYLKKYHFGYITDCSRRCPYGGKLSDDCSTCKCTDSAVFGFVKDENNHPISGVEVFLSSKQWDPFSITNAFGEFSGNGNCLIGERLMFRHNGYSENTSDVYMVNATHWQSDDVNLQTLGMQTFV